MHVDELPLHQGQHALGERLALVAHRREDDALAPVRPSVHAQRVAPDHHAVARAAVPLCVDLDGTLIRSDLLLESFLGLLKLNPLYLFLIPLWLLRGKAQFKAEIARRVLAGGTAPDAATLPWHPTFLPWLQAQKTEGRALWLCTASNHALVQPIADHLGLFDGVLASSDTHNLSGRN